MLEFGVTFLITGFNFLVLYLFLRKFLFGRVKSFMDARTLKVKRELDEAAGSRQHAEELKTRYEELLSTADREGEALLKESEARAREEYERRISEAEEDAAAVRRRADEAAERERARARDQLAGEVATLALAAARRLAEREIGTADDLREAESFIREMGAARGR